MCVCGDQGVHRPPPGGVWSQRDGDQPEEDRRDNADVRGARVVLHTNRAEMDTCRLSLGLTYHSRRLRLGDQL